MGKTGVEWADFTWNPTSGCTKISEACEHCWAERVATTRLAGVGGYPKDNPFKVTMHPDHLEDPLHWTKPAKVFVVSMGDLFHPEVPFHFIARVFAVMALAQQHTFLVLTKRPIRMLTFLRGQAAGGRFIWEAAQKIKMPRGQNKPAPGWPLPNVYLGVTAENQERADERVPILLQCPAAGYYVSCEPLLGRVDLTGIRLPSEYNVTPTTPGYINALRERDDEHFYNAHLALSWVIAGGETGPGARPTNPGWARFLRDQTQSFRVPFLFKQWGDWVPDQQFPEQFLSTYKERRWITDLAYYRVGKKAAGRLLDRQEWNQFPPEFPQG